MSTGIVGAGRMGLAMARVIAGTGATVLVCSARPVPAGPADLPAGCAAAALDELWRRCDLVLLAVPFPVALALVSGPAGRYGSGRVLVDATNPDLGRDRMVPPGVSGGELIAEAASGWRVVKAFNTVPAGQVAASRLGAARVSVPVAGDCRAKPAVFALARRIGFEPLDAGGIEASGELESLAALLVRVSTAHQLHGRIGIHIGQPGAPRVPELPVGPR